MQGLQGAAGLADLKVRMQSKSKDEKGCADSSSSIVILSDRSEKDIYFLIVTVAVEGDGVLRTSGGKSDTK